MFVHFSVPFHHKDVVPVYGKLRSLFIRHSPRLILATLLLSFGLIGISATPALASGVQVSIDVNRACQIKGHLGAQAWSTGPYGWFCYDVSFPLGISNAGGVDMQNYCNRFWPGSRAIIKDWNLYGWRCDGVRV